ncbi:unnamed protein product, partial [Ixodes pacificus]
IANRTWYDTFRSYSPIRKSKCVARLYLADTNTMYWKDQTSYNGSLISNRSWKFTEESTPFYTILFFNDAFFSQFVDTDNKSWVLLIICSPEKNPWITVLQSNPLEELSSDAWRRIRT